MSSYIITSLSPASHLTHNQSNVIQCNPITAENPRWMFEEFTLLQSGLKPYFVTLPCPHWKYQNAIDLFCWFSSESMVSHVSMPRTESVRLGPRGFSSAGPSLWNSLPTDLKVTNLTFNVFTKLLKTHLFRKAYNITINYWINVYSGLPCTAPPWWILHKEALLTWLLHYISLPMSQLTHHNNHCMCQQVRLKYPYPTCPWHII